MVVLKFSSCMHRFSLGTQASTHSPKIKKLHVRLNSVSKLLRRSGYVDAWLFVLYVFVLLCDVLVICLGWVSYPLTAEGVHHTASGDS